MFKVSYGLYNGGGSVAIIALALTFGNVTTTDPIIKIDREWGVIDCESLLRDVTRGHTDFASYTWPSIFAVSKRYETIDAYEKDHGYRFVNCGNFIDNNKASWCENKINSINAINASYILRKIGETCSYTRDDWINSFKSKNFETRIGNNNIIKVEGGWVSASSVRLTKPYRSYSPNNGLFRICVIHSGFASCKYQKNKEDAYKEHGRIEKIIAKKIYN